MLFDLLQVANNIGQSIELLNCQLNHANNNRQSSNNLIQANVQNATTTNATITTTHSVSPTQQVAPTTDRLAQVFAATHGTQCNKRQKRFNQHHSPITSQQQVTYAKLGKIDTCDQRHIKQSNLCPVEIETPLAMRMATEPIDHKPLDLSLKGSSSPTGHTVYVPQMQPQNQPNLCDNNRTLPRASKPPLNSLHSTNSDITFQKTESILHPSGYIAQTSAFDRNAHKRRPKNRKQQVTKIPSTLISSSTSPSSSVNLINSLNGCNNHLAAEFSSISSEHISSTNGSHADFEANNRKNRSRKRSSETSSSGSGEGESTGRQTGKGHLCDQCGRSFSRSDMLTRHSRLHSGHKPYQCSRCSQVFSRSDHLSTHERTHTGEKPYQCEFCPYSACRRDMITRHMRTHSGVRKITKQPEQSHNSSLICMVDDERSSPSDIEEPQSSSMDADDAISCQMSPNIA